MKRTSAGPGPSPARERQVNTHQIGNSACARAHLELRAAAVDNRAPQIKRRDQASAAHAPVCSPPDHQYIYPNYVLKLPCASASRVRCSAQLESKAECHPITQQALKRLDKAKMYSAAHVRCLRCYTWHFTRYSRLLAQRCAHARSTQSWSILSHHVHQPHTSRTVCDLCDMFDAC